MATAQHVFRKPSTGATTQDATKTVAAVGRRSNAKSSRSHLSFQDDASDEPDIPMEGAVLAVVADPPPDLDAILESQQQRSNLPVWKQQVTDEKGRKRLHGAFKGGFSAGYFNTVGTKEGWTPKTWSSSRKDRRKVQSTSVADFMDDEDLEDLMDGKRVDGRVVAGQDVVGLGKGKQGRLKRDQSGPRREDARQTAMRKEMQRLGDAFKYSHASTSAVNMKGGIGVGVLNDMEDNDDFEDQVYGSRSLADYDIARNEEHATEMEAKKRQPTVVQPQRRAPRPKPIPKKQVKEEDDLDAQSEIARFIAENGLDENSTIPEKPIITPEAETALEPQQAIIALKGYMPYQNNPEKLERYKHFLSHSAFLSATAPELTANEKAEFTKNAKMFRPMTGALASRFVSSDAPTSVAGDASDGKVKVPETADVQAAKMGLFGHMTRTVAPWMPGKAVCRLLEIPMPKVDKNKTMSNKRKMDPILSAGLKMEDSRYNRKGQAAEELKKKKQVEEAKKAALAVMKPVTKANATVDLDLKEDDARPVEDENVEDKEDLDVFATIFADGDSDADAPAEEPTVEKASKPIQGPALPPPTTTVNAAAPELEGSEDEESKRAKRKKAKRKLERENKKRRKKLEQEKNLDTLKEKDELEGQEQGVAQVVIKKRKTAADFM